MTVKEFSESELDHSQRDATKTPQFIKETVDNVFRRDNPESTVHGVIEVQPAPAPAHCHGVRILEGGCVALWDPTAPS
eukprot:1266208-Pyramimonas_sp.AAC.1